MAKIIYLIPQVYLYCNGRSYHISKECSDVKKAKAVKELRLDEIASLNRWGRGIKPCRKCIDQELRQKLINLTLPDNQQD